MDEESVKQKSIKQTEKFIIETSKSLLITMLDVLALEVALILDIIGIIFFILSFIGVGIPFSFVLDIIGGLIIGIYLYIKSKSTRGIEKGFLPVMKKILPKLVAALGVESIPFLGDIAPSWTLLVFYEFIKDVLRMPSAIT